VTILVTGTTGGIGGAVAAAARAAGHTVVAFDRADFDRDGWDGPGDLDAVVFATGCCPVKPLGATDEALFTQTFQVNCALFFRLMRTIVTRRLYASSGMRAVAVSSVSAMEGWPGGAAYCASKGALSALCRALDAELKPRGISVTAIEPRYVKTRMFDSCAGRMGVPAAAARDPADLAADILKGLTQ
jgi:NAD(P)-dependent dehydrogenase (short-subunit alcohol dehydrogenase family)